MLLIKWKQYVKIKFLFMKVTVYISNISNYIVMFAEAPTGFESWQLITVNPTSYDTSTLIIL